MIVAACCIAVLLLPWAIQHFVANQNLRHFMTLFDAANDSNRWPDGDIYNFWHELELAADACESTGNVEIVLQRCVQGMQGARNERLAAFQVLDSRKTLPPTTLDDLRRIAKTTEAPDLLRDELFYLVRKHSPAPDSL